MSTLALLSDGKLSREKRYAYDRIIQSACEVIRDSQINILRLDLPSRIRTNRSHGVVTTNCSTKADNDSAVFRAHWRCSDCMQIATALICQSLETGGRRIPRGLRILCKRDRRTIGSSPSSPPLLLPWWFSFVLNDNGRTKSSGTGRN